MVLEIDKDLGMEDKVILPCEGCGTPTMHVLSLGRNFYVCGCGCCIKIEYKLEEE